ncbi:Nicotinamidase [Thelohanellus kitauei]|uniref:nicotinamidase n=1 Tax=Thelohanellus kitauei TaxID=669202 RepID=A0A0C2MCY1_THEKT|nr:Nicotinamidase [Thelohanellus kitauei]KII65011.1 Nicotinamidase [Thelohanellus kitauei]
MKRIALVIVDIQNDFITGSLATKNAESKHDSAEIIPNIDEILKKRHLFQKIFISKDWHPVDHISFHSNRFKYSSYSADAASKLKIEQAKVFDTVEFRTPIGAVVAQVLWPDHCVQDTHGSCFHKDFKIDFPCELILKGCHPLADGYSLFQGSNEEGESFLSLLQKESIETVVFCGIALEYCVGSSAIDAVNLGYETYIIYDATARIHKTDHFLHKILQESKIKFIQTKELIEMLGNND